MKKIEHSDCGSFFERGGRQLVMLLPLLFAVASAEAQELRRSAACDEISVDQHASEYWKPPSLSVMAEEMRTPHPTQPYGGDSGWYVRPTIVMGVEPLATSLPKNWKGTPVREWRAITPWFVVFPSKDSSYAPNSAVEIGAVQMWFYSAAVGVWKVIASGEKPTWQGNYTSKGEWVRAERVPPKLRNCAGLFAPPQGVHGHGGLTKYSTPWDAITGNPGIDALVVLVGHRLVQLSTDMPDDRAFAKYVVMAGADYYPSTTSKLTDLGAPYVPGVGTGQFKLATVEWQFSSMFVKSNLVRMDDLLAVTPPGTFIIH